MDPYLCCLLGICCPPFSDEQRDTLVKMLLDRGVCDDEESGRKVVDFHLGLVKSVVEALKAS